MDSESFKPVKEVKMTEPILSFSPTPSQEEKLRVIILIPRNGESVQAVRLESECLSECIHEAWHLVHHRKIPAAFVDILALNPVGLLCSIWSDEYC